MQRVLLDLEDDAETGVRAANGSSTVWNPAVNEHADFRSAKAKRDTNRHKPTRRRSEVSRRLGPYSRLPAIAEIDQRTVEAQLMRRVRAELVDHVGGNPSVTEKLLIERAVMLSLRCAQIDIKIMAGEVLTLHDQTHSLAWYNGLRRCLVDLGLQARAPGTKETDLGDWIVRQNSKELVP